MLRQSDVLMSQTYLGECCSGKETYQWTNDSRQAKQTTHKSYDHRSFFHGRHLSDCSHAAGEKTCGSKTCYCTTDNQGGRYWSRSTYKRSNFEDQQGYQEYCLDGEEGEEIGIEQLKRCPNISSRMEDFDPITNLHD